MHALRSRDGGTGGVRGAQFLADKLTLSEPGGGDRLCPKLLLAHPNNQTFRHLCKGSRLSDFQGFQLTKTSCLPTAADLFIC